MSGRNELIRLLELAYRGAGHKKSQQFAERAVEVVELHFGLSCDEIVELRDREDRQWVDTVAPKEKGLRGR